MVSHHRTAEGRLLMTRSWIIHILLNMQLGALLGTGLPLQFTFQYMGGGGVGAADCSLGKKIPKTKEIKVFFGVT